MQDSLKKNSGAVSAIVTDIVTSRQFLNRRNETPALAANP